jgi:hypothetical protein
MGRSRQPHEEHQPARADDDQRPAVAPHLEAEQLRREEHDAQGDEQRTEAGRPADVARTQQRPLVAEQADVPDLRLRHEVERAGVGARKLRAARNHGQCGRYGSRR